MRKPFFRLFLLMAAALVFSAGWFETTGGLNKEGGKQFKEKHYESALRAYRKAQVRNPDRPETRYNLGTTLYQLDQFQEGGANLEKSLKTDAPKEFQAKAWYNYGNAQYRLGQFDKAIEAYQKALELNPDDKDAKFNLELLQKKKKLFEDKQKQRDKQNPNKKPQQNQKQQNQQNQGGGGQGNQQNQQPQQNQGSGQDQKKDQQNQGGGGKEQDQNSSQEERGEEEQTPKDQQNSNQGQDQQKGSGQPEPKPGEEKSPASMQPGQQNGEKPEEGQEQQPVKPLLQGQMSKQNALQILDALKQSEQQIQILRRPTKPQKDEQTPEKDW